MPALTLILAFTCGFFVCVAVIPLIRFLANTCGLVDRPDGRRKLHSKPIPLAGGIAIFLAVSFSFAMVLWTSLPLESYGPEETKNAFYILIGCFSICVLGIADDYGLLRGRHKLLGQILAALVIVLFGLRAQSFQFLGWHVELGVLAIPFTVAWLLGSVNSLNLIDGVDGLLGSVAFIITLAIAALAALSEKWVPACMALALAGALLGFLLFNFPPASIFLGDSGSMLIGLLIGVLAMEVSLRASATVVLVVPVTLLAVPFFDTLAAILRRKLTGRSVYVTDRGHLHHCLIRHGFSTRRLLVLVCMLCFATAMGAIASLVFQQELFAVIIVLMVIGLLIVTRLFGHSEFILVKRLVFSSVTRLLFLHPKDMARQSEIRLHGSVDWAELWSNFILFATRLNLRKARLNVNAPSLHEAYHATWETSDKETENQAAWQTEIPVLFRGQVVGHFEVIGHCDHEPIGKKISTILELVEQFEKEASIMLMLTLIPSPASIHLKTDVKLNDAVEVPASA
jgi:UDP-GlcNAc:undecaprenyl-phosphate/decaprenyl-phosphate GlcNAc-1-phosphate transferase